MDLQLHGKVAMVAAASRGIGRACALGLAREAARYYPHVEIIEKHHHTKVDAPSGTALRLAAVLREAGAGEVPVHSVRLPGLVAHHELVFGGTGEVVTLKHDTLSRASFGPGVVLAVRRVGELNRVVYDLAELLS